MAGSTITPISLSEPQEDFPPVSLSSGVQTSAPSVELSKKKTDQIQFGLKPVLNQSDDDIYKRISEGEEDQVRSEAAAKIEQNVQQKKQQDLVDYVTKQSGNITKEDVEEFIRRRSLPPADPRNVVERAWAHQYLTVADTAAQYMENNVWSEAQKEIPEYANRINDKASNVLTKLQVASNLKNDIDDEISNQGWTPWLADQAKMMFQPYTEVKMRGLNPEVGSVTGGVLLGDNLQAQADQLMFQPLDQYTENLTNIVTGLRKDNPTLARQFLEYVIGRSTNERLLDNVFTMMTPVDYAQIAKGGASLLKKATLHSATNKAFKDIVKSTIEPHPDIPLKSVQSEAAGDIQTATAVRGADQITKEITGTSDVKASIRDRLLTFFRSDAESRGTNTGKLTTDQVNRLVSSTTRAGEDLVNRLANLIRVNRAVNITENEEAVRAWQKAVRGDFPGLDNSILDIGSPDWEPITNTYHAQVSLGNFDGTLFSSPETARNFARLHGIDASDISKIQGPSVIEPERFVGKARDLERRRQISDQLKKLPDDIKNVKTKLKDKTLTKEARSKLNEDLKFFQKTQKDYTKQLGEINDRVKTIPAKIDQQGFGYKITLTKPYRETDNVVRDYLLASDKSRSVATKGGVSGWKNAVFGKYRSSDDTLAYHDTLNRKAATYGQNALREWYSERAKKIEAIATGDVRQDPITGENIPWILRKPRAILGKVTGQRQMFDQFNQTIDAARSMHDPVTKELGYFFKTNGELEDFYWRHFDRAPSFPEVEAYFAHVDLVEGNRVLSEIAEFRNRARLGAEQHQIWTQGADGKRLDSGFFDGTRVSQFPGGDDQILIMGKKIGEEQLHTLGQMDISPQELERIRNAVANGQATVIRIYDPDSHPLSSFSDIAGEERVRYIYSEGVESKPLDINHVARRGGGHFEYDYDYYIKQAKVVAQSGGAAGSDKRRVFHNTYVGDATLMALENRVIGKDLVKHLEEVRKLIKADKLDEAKAYVKSSTLPMEWSEILGWFKPGRNAQGKVTLPRFSLDQEFRVVGRNQKIYDLDKTLEDRFRDPRTGKTTFKDGTKSGSDAQQFQVAYNMERDAEGLKAIEAEGSQGNPVYKYVPARLADPIPTMNRSIARAIHSTFMDDYKISAIETWLEEAAPYMKATRSELRSAPFYHFKTASKDAFKANKDNDDIIRGLLANKFKIDQFTGIPDTFDSAIHSAQQLLADAMYESFGPKSSRNWVTLTPEWLLSKVRDPVNYLRSMAFNYKLGFFNVAQFLVQAQSHATIWAISPKHGTVGTYGALLHSWARFNGSEEILKGMDEYATKLNLFGSNFKPGEWKEAYEELQKTGFSFVSGEHQMRDDQLTKTFVGNDWGNFLDAGQFFFREGERSTRLTAWYTAFREFREANPTGALTLADRQKILNRADLLTNNMSRASASMLHTGVFGLTTQFLTYQLRAMELFMGKRLGETVGERAFARARLLSFYGALYGAPSALGVAGIPAQDAIKKYAQDNGYVVGENWITTAFNEGIPAWLGAVVTGKGDYQKGNVYNIGDRYGMQGFTQINDALFADKPIYQMLGGAGLNIFADRLKDMHPYWMALRSLMSKDEKDNQFALKADDMWNFMGLSEISSVTGIRKLLGALNTGKWMNKNEQYIGDTSKLNALFQTVTGLQSQDQSDVFTKGQISKAIEENQKKGIKEIKRDYERMIQASANNDTSSALDYAKRIKAYGIYYGIPENKMPAIYSQAAKGYEGQIKNSQWNFGVNRNIPDDKKEARQDQLTRQLKLNEYRNQP